MLRKEESKDPSLTFEKISGVTAVQEDQIHLLVLKANNLGLVNLMKIEMQNRVVHFSQAESRILEKRVIILL